MSQDNGFIRSVLLHSETPIFPFFFSTRDIHAMSILEFALEIKNTIFRILEDPGERYKLEKELEK